LRLISRILGKKHIDHVKSELQTETERLGRANRELKRAIHGGQVVIEVRQRTPRNA
jgi:hypothetical protein